MRAPATASSPAPPRPPLSLSGVFSRASLLVFTDQDFIDALDQQLALPALLNQFTMSRHPEIVWAQRSEYVFLTVELPDAKSPKVKLEPEGKFTFSATAGADEHLFEIELELFGKVNVESSKINVGLRNIKCIIQKEEKGWWKRLLKSEGKSPPYIKVDWNKWVEEDEDTGGSKFDDVDFGAMDDFSV